MRCLLQDRRKIAIARLQVKDSLPALAGKWLQDHFPTQLLHEGAQLVDLFGDNSLRHEFRKVKRIEFFIGCEDTRRTIQDQRLLAQRQQLRGRHIRRIDGGVLALEDDVDGFVEHQPAPGP